MKAALVFSSLWIAASCGATDAAEPQGEEKADSNLPMLAFQPINMHKAFEDTVVEGRPDGPGFTQVGIRVSLPHINDQLPDLELVEEPFEGACVILGTDKELKSEVGFYIITSLFDDGGCTFSITLPTGEQATLWYTQPHFPRI